MSQISVSDNKIIYTPLTSGLQGTYIHRKGPNKFGENLYSNTQHIVAETTWYKVLNLMPGNTQFRELSRFDIHGTLKMVYSIIKSLQSVHQMTQQ